jgi:hypothetical protein
MNRKLSVDKVIVASDFGPKFINFWPIVAQAWKIVFGLEPELALVYRKSDFQRLEAVLPQLEKFGKVHVFEGVAGAPLGNQAKLARFYVASQYPDHYVMVDDIDTIHVRADYLQAKFALRPEDKFRGLGAEVYRGTPHQRNFPAGNFSGKGYLFGDLLNSEKNSFQDYIRNFRDLGVFSKREDPFNKPSNFSDEYLISAMFARKKMEDKLDLIDRGQDIKTEWLDRSWWFTDDEIRANKESIEVINFLRPLKENMARIQRALDILCPGIRIELILDESTKINFFRKALSRWVAI